MYIKKIKLFILVILVTILTGCGGGGGSAGSSYANIDEGSSTSMPAAKTIHEGQVKDSQTGNGLADVKVSIAGSSTITDKNGFYTLSDLAENEEATVNFEKEGYLIGSTQIQLKSLSRDNTVSPNYLEYAMHQHNNQWYYDSTEEITDDHITIDASVSYRDINGKPYNGMNTIELSILNITTNEGKDAFPGAFKGINSNGTTVQFDSYGLISIVLEDSKGNKLRLTDGETVTLRFDQVSSLEKPATLPLWYYDYEQGLWSEESYAELQEDGSYQGEISHLGTWSVNRVLENEPGIYRGRIIDQQRLPVSDIRVYALGENWIGSDLTTDENGMFEIEVIPDSSFQIKAYNYKDKYSATYANTLPTISAGKVIGI